MMGTLATQWSRLAAVSYAALLLVTAAGAQDAPAIWTDLQLATAPDSVLPRAPAIEEQINRAYRPAHPAIEGRAGRSALLQFDGVVLVTVITLADMREESFRVPREGGGTMGIYHGQIIIGGTVLAFSPLARTVLTTAPLLGVRKLLLEERPSDERVREEALAAATAFAGVARARGEALGGRARRAAIRRPVLGRPVLQAGSDDGVRPGLVVAAVDGEGTSGVSCTVAQVASHEATLDCPQPVPERAVGHFLRSFGADVERYQVETAAITSDKARALFSESLVQEQVAIAFAASDQLAAKGFTVLPPGGEDGEKSAMVAVREFVARHGLSERELEKFSIRFPPPEAQLQVVVDGYNTGVVQDGAVNLHRIHKAWATVSDGRGHKAEGVASLVVDEIKDWQEEGLQRADARQAVLDAVRCAIGRLVGAEGGTCS